MDFVDRVVLWVRAGRGGSGAVHFRREKFRPRGGPDGGDGGDGGSIYLQATTRKQTLAHLAGRSEIKARAGEPGGGNRRTGASGADITLVVPLGTVVTDRQLKQVLWDVSDEHRRLLVAGGKGGRGNWHFKSAINQTPRWAELGQPGEERRVSLTLKLIANIGLVGLPNAGKSTLLNVLTAARAKTAAYPFTTLYPNLGVWQLNRDRELIVADIPGLISGAAQGKGLGHDFLRHVERTQALLHLVSLTDDDPVTSYQTLRQELQDYQAELTDKPHLVVLTKSDQVDEATAKHWRRQLQKISSCQVEVISASRQVGLKDMARQVNQMLDKGVNSAVK